MKILMCSALALALAAPVAAQKTGTTSTTSSASTTDDGSQTPKSTKGHGAKSHKADRSTPTGSVTDAVSDNAATPATPATPADPMTGTGATPATPATPSANAAATPGQANDPATILRTEFPSYDKDSSGALSKEEFSTWLTALKNAAPQQTPMTDAQQKEWLGSAFTEADADKSSSISLAELTTYLTRGSKG